jgi:hypothetical protein
MKRIFLGLFFFSVLVFFCCFSSSSFAQVPGDPGNPGCDPLDPTCPIDGGLSLLIAAGIGLAAKRAYQEKKKASDQPEL